MLGNDADRTAPWPVHHEEQRRFGADEVRSTLDGTLPIDSSGTLTGTDDMDGPFQDAIELTKRFATSQQVRDCMATQWLRYAVRRDETGADDCSQQQIRSVFRETGDMKRLVLAVVQSDAFRYKTQGTP